MQCLAKDPDERWQSADDLRSELQWIAEGGLAGRACRSRSRRSPRDPPADRLAVAAALFAAVAAAALVIAWRSGHGPEPLAFRQLNFRREAVFQAAFAADGETSCTAPRRSGNTPRIFTVRPEYPEPQPLGPPRHAPARRLVEGRARRPHRRALRVAPAVHRNARAHADGGGAPREIQEGVRQADWSPDGSELAIIREVEGRDRLEYPIGRVLAEGGYLTDVRVSPRGDRLAYFEHPSKWDDRGSVNVVDLAGKKTVLSEGYWSERGLAWSPDGRELLFSASQSGGSYTVYAVTLGGKRRIAYQPPGGLTIQDVARDGRWLATRGDFRYGAMVRTPGASEDRDLSWLNTSHARALSQDGGTLLFAETAVGANYAVCIRKTDGSPVVRLGEGWPADLSPDGRSVLAVVQSRPPRLVIYPTGAGETRPLERGELESYASAQWFRDGQRVLVGGNEPRKGTRFYVQDAGGGAPRPVTPEETRDGWISPDGTQVLARGPGERYSLYPVQGGEPRAVPGLGETDSIAHWSPDGRSVLAYRRAEIPCRLERVVLATGERTLFKELAPADRAGLLSLRGVFVTDDLRSYAYTTYHQVSPLFVSERSP